MKRSASKVQRGVRELDVVLNGSTITTSASTTGVDEGTYHVTAAKDGVTAGKYTITFNLPFARAPRVVASALGDTEKIFATLVSVSTSSCVIQVWSDGGTATAADKVHVNVCGFDVASPN